MSRTILFIVQYLDAENDIYFTKILSTTKFVQSRCTLRLLTLWFSLYHSHCSQLYNVHHAHDALTFPRKHVFRIKTSDTTHAHGRTIIRFSIRYFIYLFIYLIILPSIRNKTSFSNPGFRSIFLVINCTDFSLRTCKYLAVNPPVDSYHIIYTRVYGKLNLRVRVRTFKLRARTYLNI